MILPDLITQKASTIPDGTAFIFRDEKISFAELEKRINLCAAGLNKLGIKKGSTFAVVLRNSPEFVVLAMALSKLGAVVIPINFLEKPDRIALILNDAKAVGVLTGKEFLKCVEEARKNVPSIQHVFIREEFSKLMG